MGQSVEERHLEHPAPWLLEVRQAVSDDDGVADPVGDRILVGAAAALSQLTVDQVAGDADQPPGKRAPIAATSAQLGIGSRP